MRFLKLSNFDCLPGTAGGSPGFTSFASPEGEGFPPSPIETLKGVDNRHSSGFKMALITGHNRHSVLQRCCCDQ